MKNGYGKLGRGGKTWLAHRFAWTQENGPIPDGLHVLHKCDNRKCIKVEHLFLGTRFDNMKDMIAKGRHRTNPNRGEKNHNAVLSSKAVSDIRTLRSMKIPRKVLAKMYGCSVAAVDHVIYNQSWRHSL
jgi:hypothetical protein